MSESKHGDNNLALAIAAIESASEIISGIGRQLIGLDTPPLTACFREQGKRIPGATDDIPTLKQRNESEI